VYVTPGGYTPSQEGLFNIDDPPKDYSIDISDPFKNYTIEHVKHLINDIAERKTYTITYEPVRRENTKYNGVDAF
jgi:hypothetical protein